MDDDPMQIAASKLDDSSIVEDRSIIWDRAAAFMREGRKGNSPAATDFATPLKANAHNVRQHCLPWRNLVLGLYMVLPIFSTPPAIRGPSDGELERWPLPQMLVGDGKYSLICIPCLILLLTDRAVSVYTKSFRSLSRMSQVQLMTILFVLATMTFRAPYWRSIEWLLRPIIFALTSTATKKALGTFCRLFLDKQVVIIFAAIGGHVLIFAWIGILIFNNTEEGKQYFSTVPQALQSLVLMLTSTDFPGVMMPAYTMNRWYFLYFFAFLVFGLFTTFPLILANLYNVYRESLGEQYKRFTNRRTIAFKHAFDVLAVPTPLHDDVVVTLADFVGSFPRWTKLPLHVEQAEYMFAAVGSDDECLNRDMFLELCFGICDPEVGVIACWPKDAPKPMWPSAMKRISPIVQNWAFDFVVDAILFVDFLNNLFFTNYVIGAERGYPDIDKQWLYTPDYTSLTSGEVIMHCFAWFFFAEIIMRVIAAGAFRLYWANCSAYEPIIVMVAWFTEVWNICPLTASPPSFYKVITVVRILRDIRLATRRSDVLMFFRTLKSIAPALYCFLALEITTLWFFAALGNVCFYGVLDPRNPAMAETVWKQSGYEANNFNDFASALVVLFQELAMTSWGSLTEACVIATGYRVAALYFIVHWLINVVAVTNLLVAFLVEAFSARCKVDPRTCSLAQEAIFGEGGNGSTEMVSMGAAQSRRSMQRRQTRELVLRGMFTTQGEIGDSAVDLERMHVTAAKVSRHLLRGRLLDT